MPRRERLEPRGNSRSKRRGSLDLSIRALVGKAHVAFLRAHVRKAHKLLGSDIRELSIALVNDRTMSELHDRYLGLATPTDVLTFPLELATSGAVKSGEIVVCVPEATRRARGNVPVRNELLLYTLHGLLHLMGHDDTLPDGFETMHRIEDEILDKLGVGAVFRVASPPRRAGASRAAKTSTRRKRSTEGRSQ